MYICAACLGMVVGIIQLYSEKICHVVSTDCCILSNMLVSGVIVSKVIKCHFL